MVTAMMGRCRIDEMKLFIPEKENRSHRPPLERSDDFVAIFARFATKTKRKDCTCNY